MRVVVGLFDQAELFPLVGIQAGLDAVRLAQVLERKDEQLGVVLVVKRRERNRAEFPALEPVHHCRVDGDSLFRGQIRAILEKIVLPLLFGLDPQTSEAANVLFGNRLVDSGTASDALAVEVGNIGPPVRLCLDVAKDHVFHGDRQAGNLPWNVCLPAPPRLGQVLQDGPLLVCLYAFRHHVEDVVHDGSTQLEVVVAFDALLGDRLGYALGMATFKVASKQVSEPSLEKRHDAAQKEDPHTPRRSPEAAAWAFADGPGVEAIVYQMLQVLAHPNLLHQLVLVAVHAS